MSPKTYTPRERVRAALAHKEPDRIPLDLGATGSTGICGHAYHALRKHMGLPDKPLKIWHVMQQLAQIDEDLLGPLGVDVRTLSSDPMGAGELEIFEKDGFYNYIDEWGIGFHMPIENGHYYDMYHHPLANAETIRDVERHNWPDPTELTRYEGLAEAAKKMYEETDVAITFASYGAGQFDMLNWLCGLEQGMMNLASNLELSLAIMEKVTDLKCQYLETTLPMVAPYIDVVMECDDLGCQNGPLFSPKTYHQYIKPMHTRVFDTIRKHTDATIYFHSCGSVTDFLPGLIESGVQALNPVQVSAANMDTKMLKREFGKDIVFWGGGCDTQKILWQGTTQQVRDEVKRRIDDLAPGGGLIFAQVHNIQNGVPPENLIAMWESWKEFGKY